MGIKVVECLNWAAPNKPGKLLQYAEHLRKEKIDLEALWAYTSANGEGKIAAIGKNPARLRAALLKGGVSADASQCFYLTGKDKAGALVSVLKRLSDADINVACADAIAGGGKFGATIWVDDLGKAKRALRVR
jgi:hypothetical protein